MNIRGFKNSPAASSGRSRSSVSLSSSRLSLLPPVPLRGAAPLLFSLPPPNLHLLLRRRRPRLLLPPVCSQDRQRNAPTEGNLSAGRPARNKPVEPPTKLALRGNNGSGGSSSGSKLPPHVPHSKKLAHPEEAERAAASASSSASSALQFLTALVAELEASASRRADEVAAAAEGDFEAAFYRRKMDLLEENGSHLRRDDPKHLRKTLLDAAELRRGQLRALRHAVRGDVQALVREGKASKGEAARADAAVEGAFKKASAALEGAAASALERAAKLSG